MGVSFLYSVDLGPLQAAKTAGRECASQEKRSGSAVGRRHSGHKSAAQPSASQAASASLAHTHPQRQYATVGESRATPRRSRQSAQQSQQLKYQAEETDRMKQQMEEQRRRDADLDRA